MEQYLVRLLRFLSRLRTPATITLKQIKAMLATDAPVILEIGAADGLDTLKFLETFSHPALRMYCFEPDPRNIAAFKEHVRDPRVRLLEAAVSDTDGPAFLYQSSTIYSSSLKAPNLDTIQATWPEITFPKTLSVQSLTLDTFIRDEQLALVDFIWADVQGAEDLLLKGGHKSLAHNVRYLYTEYSDIPYYHAEPSLKTIRSILGPHWTMIRDCGTDALFKNNKLS